MHQTRHVWSGDLRWLPAIAVASLLGAYALLGFGCSSDDDSISGPNPPDTTTPRRNAEAELAALWQSGDLIAPQALYERIASDLTAVRRTYRAVAPAVDIPFTAPWPSSRVLVGLTREGLRLLRTGTFDDFDDLGAAFEITELDSTHYDDPTPWVVLSFAGRRHPERIAEAYEELDEVVYARPSRYIGDWPNVYPGRAGNLQTYLFREASIDCSSGCELNQFYYFKVDPWRAVIYVGSYDPEVDAQPRWWTEAMVAYLRYQGILRD